MAGNERPGEMVGVSEQPLESASLVDQIGGILLPNRNPVPQWVEQHSSYTNRAKEADRGLSQCQAQGDCSARVAAHNVFVETLKSSGFTDKEKAEAVNVWVNEALHYDTEKPFDGADDHQTAFATLTSGKGQCGDFARLKYEMLKEVGIKDDAMRLVNGAKCDEQGRLKGAAPFHGVLVVNADGGNYVLDNDAPVGGSAASVPEGGLSPVDKFMRLRGFVPMTAENESGIKGYPFTVDGDGRYAFPRGQIDRSSIYANKDKSTLVSGNESPYLIGTTRDNISPEVQATADKVREQISLSRSLNPLRQEEAKRDTQASLREDTVSNLPDFRSDSRPPMKTTLSAQSSDANADNPKPVALAKSDKGFTHAPASRLFVPTV